MADNRPIPIIGASLPKMAHSTDSKDSSCESVESDDQSVLWVSDWYAADEAEDVDHEEVTRWGAQCLR